MNKQKLFYGFSIFLVVCFISSVFILFGKIPTLSNESSTAQATTTLESATTNNANVNPAKNQIVAAQAVNISTPSLQKKEIYKACYSFSTIGENQQVVNDTLGKFGDVSKKVSTGDERAIVYFDLGQDKAQATTVFNQFQNTIFKGFAMEQDNDSYIVRVATLANYNSAKQQVDGLNTAMNGKGITGTWHARNITKINYDLTLNSAQSETDLLSNLKGEGKLNKISCN
jgi:phage tail tube protein FII